MAMERYDPVRIDKKWQKGPDDIARQGDPLGIIKNGYGMDALQTYEMFIGPIEPGMDTSQALYSVGGIYRFLRRSFDLAFGEPAKAEKDANIVLRNKTIKRVTDDIHRYSFNTAVAALMEYVNELYRVGVEPADIETLAKLLKPFAPHLACEILEKINVTDDEWPVWDDNYLVDDVVEVVVQVNGKLRAKLSVALEELENEDKIKELALADEKVKKFITGEPKKVIFVKKAKLVNIVA